MSTGALPPVIVNRMRKPACLRRTEEEVFTVLEVEPLLGKLFLRSAEKQQTEGLIKI
jgi:hypothetical protein